MRKSTAVWFVIGGVLILVGATIFCTVMSILNWNFLALDTNKYETNVYESDESVGDVKMDLTTADVTFLASEDGKIKVVCYENSKNKHSVRVKNGVLSIGNNDLRKWYNYIGINFDSPKVTVYLPSNNGFGLEMNITTGDVKIAKEFKLFDVDIHASTGDVECLAYSAKNIKIEGTTGDVKIAGTEAKSVEIKVTTASCSLENVKLERVKMVCGTGNITLNNVAVESFASLHTSSGDIAMKELTVGESTYIHTTTGDVKFKGGFGAELSVEATTGDVMFDNFDANKMDIKTTTGSVTGILRTSKHFMVNTTTGDVNVEKYWRGYECNVRTTTGDVSIECLAIDEDGPHWRE